MKHHLPRLATAMTPFPYSVTSDTSLADARALLADHDFHHLPVTDGDNVVGILHSDQLAPEARGSVAEHHRPAACVVDIETPLADVLRHMVDARADAAAILRHGRLVGVFTTTDACRALAALLDELSPPPADDLVA